MDLLVRVAPYLVAACLCVLGGWWVGHQGVHAERAACTKDKADAAQKTALAYGRELEAARERADAAESAAREAARQSTADAAALETALRKVRNAPRIASSCVPDSLRVSINAAVSAANRSAKTDDAK